MINSRCIVKGVHVYAWDASTDLYAGLILAFHSFTIILQAKKKKKKKQELKIYSFQIILSVSIHLGGTLACSGLLRLQVHDYCWVVHKVGKGKDALFIYYPALLWN